MTLEAFTWRERVSIVFSGALLEELERHHKREPLARGMLRETLREKVFTHSAPELFAGVICAT